MNTPLARPVLKRRYLPTILIWLLPVVVLGFAFFLLRDLWAEKGTEIEIHFSDAAGLKENETRLVYRGVEVAKVEHVELSDDHKQAVVRVRLPRREAIFASKGASYWIVRPEVSQAGLKGLDTLMTGPYIQGNPGKGEEAEREFRGLAKEPRIIEDGLRLTLTTHHLGHIQDGSEVQYRGIPVGEVQEIELSPDATQVKVKLVVWNRYQHLVKEHTKFWVDSGFDFKGGILAGVHLKLDSLKTVISGGVSFATPEKDQGAQVKDGAVFALEEDVKKEWQDWNPSLPISPKPISSPAVPAMMPTTKKK